MVSFDLTLLPATAASSRAGALPVQSARLVWQAVTDEGLLGSPNEGSDAFAVGESRVFYLRGAKLSAVDAATGRRLWEAKPRLIAPILYRDGRVYAASADLTLQAFSAASGELLWTSTKTRRLQRLDMFGGLILGTQSGGVVALEAATSERRWNRSLDGSGGPALSANGVLVWGGTVGEPRQDSVSGVDLGTGKQLWSRGGVALYAEGRSLYLLDRFRLYTEEIRIHRVDIRTGRTLSTVEYALEFPDPSASPTPSYDPVSFYGAVMDAHSVWPYAKDGNTFVVERHGRDGQAQGGPTRYTARGSENFLFGVYGSATFLVETRSGRLLGLNPSGREGPAHPSSDGPVRDLHVSASTLYLERAGGRLQAVDLRTGEASSAFTVALTGPGGVRSVAEREGVVIVRTFSGVAAFKPAGP